MYLDEEVRAFVQAIAEKRKTDLSTVVNQLLRRDKRLAEAMKQGDGEHRLKQTLDKGFYFFLEVG